MKRHLEHARRAMGLEYKPTFANFLLIKVGREMGTAVADALPKRGIVVRPACGYGLPDYIRVSFGTRAENERFVRALRKVFLNR